MKVVSYVEQKNYHSLPLPSNRTTAEGTVVGKAAKSFNMYSQDNPAYPGHGYMVGHLKLPPKGIKDEESVGLGAHVLHHSDVPTGKCRIGL